MWYGVCLITVKPVSLAAIYTSVGYYETNMQFSLMLVEESEDLMLIVAGLCKQTTTTISSWHPYKPLDGWKWHLLGLLSCKCAQS